MSLSSAAESSTLLLLLEVLVAGLAAHVFVGWVRVAHHAPGWRRWGAIAVAAFVFATGLSVATSLGLTGEALAFPIGFHAVTVLAFWLGGWVLLMGLAAWPAYRPGTVPAIGVGILLAAVALALQWGWMRAVGFRPGLVWREEMLALAWVVMSIGFAAGLTLALPSSGRRQRPETWRAAGAALVGLTALAGQAIVHAGANLQSQVGSIYRLEVSAPLLSLIGGAALPLALIMLAVDLELRRRDRHRSRRMRHRRSRSDDAAAPAASSASASTSASSSTGT